MAMAMAMAMTEAYPSFGMEPTPAASSAATPEGGFIIGQRVSWNGSPGTVQYLGEVSFDKGDWVGVALDKPEGMHNGTVFGKTYFHCADKCGILSPPSGLQTLDDGWAAPTTGEDWAESAEWYQGWMAGWGKGKTSKPGDWHCPNCNDLQFARNAQCRKCLTPRPHTMVEAGAPSGKGAYPKYAKPGDWKCPNCGDLQFARNSQCRQCGEERPNTLEALAAQSPGPAPVAGDWICPTCSDFQFARNLQCRKCATPRPMDEAFAEKLAAKQKQWTCDACQEPQPARNNFCRKCGGPNPDPVTVDESEMVLGGGSKGSFKGKGQDWECPACGDFQFARNTHCRKCGQPNPNPSAGRHFNLPPEYQKPGDWHCPTCNDLQFARNAQCRRCGTPNPTPPEARGKGKGGDPPGWNCPGCQEFQPAKSAQCRKCGTASPLLTGGAEAAGITAAQLSQVLPSLYGASATQLQAAGLDASSAAALQAQLQAAQLQQMMQAQAAAIQQAQLAQQMQAIQALHAAQTGGEGAVDAAALGATAQLDDGSAQLQQQLMLQQQDGGARERSRSPRGAN
eukprot:CAMPEP_0178405654 /NCGR_PEP_ID=MMETSP0689_2-20121128/18511_1 /TAXON_ID=160604 /ORGANISM="Amphidinium massartii, Strain CS-259" /LENGTH=564 /DNA_ID=CAMNT_0020026677 /DNA_START=226 /DNA_END=1920 /DNA_ORIENTATION=+